MIIILLDDNVFLIKHVQAFISPPFNILYLCLCQENNDATLSLFNLETLVDDVVGLDIMKNPMVQYSFP